MDIRPPIYRDRDEIYQADSCKPLVDALDSQDVELNTLARGAYPGTRLNRIDLPGISTMGFWDANGPQNWGLPFHRNEGIEICLLETGKLPFTVDDHQLLLKPNDMTITRPWQLHKLGDPNITSSRLHWIILDVNVRRPNQPWKWPKWIILTKSDLQELTNIMRHNEQPIWHATDQIQLCFKNISNAIMNNVNSSHISRLSVYINELFVLVLEMLRHQSDALDPALSSSLRTVELFLADLRHNRQNLIQPWTVALMAEQCGLGITRFRHLCKQLTNMTPMPYLNLCRVQAASRILSRNPNRPIIQIAMDCGFESSQYFATVFAQHYHCSPTQYRKQS